MKKILLTTLIALGTFGLTMTAANAKCNGGDKKMEKPAKCQAGKCQSGKCGTDKAGEKKKEDTNKTEEKAAKGKCGAGKCGGK